jgi:hypothetical protein
MMFDPWTASFEDAKALQAERGFSVDPAEPVYQWNAVQQINALKQAVDNGNGFAVLACIRDCVTHGLIAPEWLAYAFNRKYDAVLNFRAKNWDDPKAFGPPRKKHVRLAAERKRLAKEWQVWNLARDILAKAPDMPIDAGFFEHIGQAIKPPIGKTLASEHYYRIAKLV